MFKKNNFFKFVLHLYLRLIMYTNTNCLNVRIFVNIVLLNNPNKLIGNRNYFSFYVIQTQIKYQ